MAQLKTINGSSNTYINKNMIVSIVNLATKEIQGVKDVYQPKRMRFKSLFNKNVGKGVKVKYTNFGLIIDIYIVVETNVEVNDVVYRIQQNVKNSIASLLPLNIKAINVHIMDAAETNKKDTL